MRWQCINKSVQGASHKRKSVECQDYSMVYHSGETQQLSPVILAVADGHGGDKYIRSKEGAKLACQSAIEVGKKYLDAVFEKETSNIIKEVVENRFKQDVLRCWQTKTIKHFSENTLNENELSIVPLDFDLNSLDDTMDTEEDYKEKIYMLYGTTLLIVIIMDNMIISWQIGDGDILFVNNENEVLRTFEKDSELIANETTSLCSKNALNHFHSSIQYLYDKQNVPKIIMLSTDGYLNSFKSIEDFYKVPLDYCNIISEDGVSYILENIDKWLDETSESGSGDDITIVLAFAE